jgi:hypothetical protein
MRRAQSLDLRVIKQLGANPVATIPIFGDNFVRDNSVDIVERQYAFFHRFAPLSFPLVSYNKLFTTESTESTEAWQKEGSTAAASASLFSLPCSLL